MRYKQLMVLGLMLMAIGLASATTVNSGMISARQAICDILYNIRDLLFYIAAGVAVVVITLQGIKWTGSADDPGARKQAKEGIVHAVIGLIIVMIAVWIVVLVFTGSQCALPV
ncbi:MAG: pilin [Candidatus Altiarchaeota archaeon]|nr:pilin [Candidatus Altiarchaeota archaeon]